MYKLIQRLDGELVGIHKDNEDGSAMGIPLDPANSDYQVYLKWLEEGNTPAPAEGVA